MHSPNVQNAMELTTKICICIYKIQLRKNKTLVMKTIFGAFLHCAKKKQSQQQQQQLFVLDMKNTCSAFRDKMI